MNASAHYQPVEPADLPLITDIQEPPWREALLAALPHFWLGVSLALDKLAEPALQGLHTRSATTLINASFVIFLGVSLLISLYAFLRAFPLWTASWYSYAAWSLIVMISFLTAKTGIDNWALNSILAIGSIAIVLIGYLFIFRLSRLHALLTALFLLPVASQIGLESIPSGWEALIALVFGLLASFVAIYVLRSWDWLTGVVFAICANLLAGLLLAYVAIFKTEIPGFYGDSLSDAFSVFILYAVISLALFLGPALFWRIWNRLVPPRRAA